MTPYYEHDGITIYHGDCRQILPAVARESCDLILADPPYGDTSLDWDVRDLAWLDLSEPTLKVTGSVWCFGSLRMFMAQASDLARGWRVAQDVIWEKHNGSSFHADRFKRVHEHAMQFYRKDSPWESIYKHPVTTPDATPTAVRRKRRPTHTGRAEQPGYVSHDGGPKLMRSVIYVRSCHGGADHPTQKPEGILRPLIEYSCPPGGTVLDPTMGAGSTLVVARELGRRAIGIELQEQYCEAAVRRLAQAALFVGGV